jgi:hypothetical protein
MFHTLLRQMCVAAHKNGSGLDLRYFEVMLKDLVLLYSSSHLTHISITLPKSHVITNGNPKLLSEQVTVLKTGKTGMYNGICAAHNWVQ